MNECYARQTRKGRGKEEERKRNGKDRKEKKRKEQLCHSLCSFLSVLFFFFEELRMDSFSKKKLSPPFSTDFRYQSKVE